MVNLPHNTWYHRGEFNSFHFENATAAQRSKSQEGKLKEQGPATSTCCSFALQKHDEKTADRMLGLHQVQVSNEQLKPADSWFAERGAKDHFENYRAQLNREV